MKEKNLSALRSNILISGLEVLVLLNYRAISLILQHEIFKKLVTLIMISTKSNTC